MNDEFTDACFDAMAFTDCHGDNPEMRDSDGWSATLTARIASDCAQFQGVHAALLLSAYECLGYGPVQAGHDFWLTRNGHGAGFWDRDLGSVGDALTAAAHVWGPIDLYVGDDNLIYGS